MMPRGKITIWAQGFGTFFHRVHIAAAHIGRAALVFLGVWGLIWDVCLYLFAPRAGEYFWDFVIGSLRSFLLDGGSAMRIAIHGETVTAPAWQVRDYAWQHFPWLSFWVWGVLSLGGCVSLAIVAVRLLVRRGANDLTDLFVRGQRMVAPEDVAALIPPDDRSPFQIGGVPVPASKLARNVLAVGSMGAGKSQAILHLMDTARDSGKKTVVYDFSGEFVERYFREGRDILLNPLDARCAPWSLFADIRRETDPAALAEFFVPDKGAKSNQDPIWDEAAKMLLEDVIRIVGRRTKRTMAELLRVLAQPVDALIPLLAGMPSSASINDKNPKGSQSVQFSLLGQPAIRFFKFFDREGTFSIRDWVQHEDDSWLFIASRADQHATIKPFASAWLQIAMMAAMELRPTTEIRMLLILDELASLKKMPALEPALTLGRKFGICTIAGIQNAAQLDELYGQDITKVLLANLQTKLVLRTEEESSAKRLAEILGKAELDEVQENINLGGEDEQHTSALVRQKQERFVVLPTEIQILKDLEGYLKIAGEFPVCKVQIPYRARPVIAPEFVEREGLQFVWGEQLSSGGPALEAEGVGESDPFDVPAAPDTDQDQETDWDEGAWL
ncbi:type IV secretion system DNA-binding domain-containing protein [Acidithiobacillus caldus]|uniref:type IV secretion system DNA-binding domain-containing protein n=1 Tax=Acidithiobacillus caldus TaxID=33059 RepID=UPI001C068046|nr:type IV secretion system DNA-binding domain-containing protein [Acidithiobacillus caldus]MBU2762836.1 type IV secretion system DNA-binding domain-containing protein [Acidithiobacillus caldus]